MAGNDSAVNFVLNLPGGPEAASADLWGWLEESHESWGGLLGIRIGEGFPILIELEVPNLGRST